MSTKLTLAVDFDGVLHDHKHPVTGRRMGIPFPDARPAMIKLTRQGHMLIIHTVMATTPGGTKAVEDWLRYYKIPYASVTAIKPNADYYVDDRAIRHTDWKTTLEAIT